MIISSDNPKLYESMILNKDNYNKIAEHVDEFNKEAYEQFGIKYGIAMFRDRIIVDDLCKMMWVELIDSIF